MKLNLKFIWMNPRLIKHNLNLEWLKILPQNLKVKFKNKKLNNKKNQLKRRL